MIVARHASRWASRRVIYKTNPSFVRADALHSKHVRGKNPQGPAPRGVYLKRDREGALYSARLAKLSHTLSFLGLRYATIAAVVCNRPQWRRAGMATWRRQAKQRGGRIAGGCVSSAAHVVGGGCGNCCTARPRRMGDKRAFQACIRHAEQFFRAVRSCLV